MPRAPAARAPRPVARLPAHRRRAYDEHTRWEVVWCLLATGACSARETQEAIARTGTPLEGAHAVPSLSTIRRIRRRYRETGEYKARARCGPMISLSGSQMESLRSWCKRPGGQRRGTRLRRACAWFDVQFKRRVPPGTVCRWLKRMGLTRKKGSRTALQQDPEKVAFFWDQCQRHGLDPWATVWFDECGFDFRDFQMLYGYSPCGERFYTEERLGRGERINCLASMWAGGAFEVEFFHAGSITYEVFEGHCARSLAPGMLRRGMKFLVMDNARIHHAHGNKIVAYFKALGITVIWLAPYWPQGNPIGMCRLADSRSPVCAAAARARAHARAVLSLIRALLRACAENLFGWIKCALKDLRDELELLSVPLICARVRGLFDTAGAEGRAFRWTRRCGYFTD